MQNYFKEILIKKANLTPKVASEMVNLFDYQSYPSGTILAHPGILNTKAAYVHSGILKHYMLSKKGKEIIFDFPFAPNLTSFSSVGFFMQWPSQMFCETVTDVDLLVAESKDIMALADIHPSIYELLLWRVTEVYRDRQIKEFGIIEKTSKERYQDFVQTYSDYLDIIPSKSIASYLNIQPGSLSRIRKKHNS